MESFLYCYFAAEQVHDGSFWVAKNFTGHIDLVHEMSVELHALCCQNDGTS